VSFEKRIGQTAELLTNFVVPVISAGIEVSEVVGMSWCLAKLHLEQGLACYPMGLPMEC